MKHKDPFKKILKNAQDAQKWNKWHQSKNINRPIKHFFITEEDLKHVFNEQNGLSKWLKIPLNLDDVFRKNFPLAPSLDRIDNNKDYTPENICLSTRFENWGFNKASSEIKQECIIKINMLINNKH